MSNPLAVKTAELERTNQKLGELKAVMKDLEEEVKESEETIEQLEYTIEQLDETISESENMSNDLSTFCKDCSFNMQPNCISCILRQHSDLD